MVRDPLRVWEGIFKVKTQMFLLAPSIESKSLVAHSMGSNPTSRAPDPGFSVHVDRGPTPPIP